MFNVSGSEFRMAHIFSDLVAHNAVPGIFMLLPLVVALLYGESVLPFLIPILILTVIGLVLRAVRPGQTALFARDGLAVVALALSLIHI